MSRFLFSGIGRLRLIAFLEGFSLILLVGIGMPLKYLKNDPSVVKLLGPLHGALFTLFILVLLNEAFSRKWKWSMTALILLIGSFIPFGTFYVDNRWLKPLHV
jgi:integral membrane protein